MECARSLGPTARSLRRGGAGRGFRGQLKGSTFSSYVGLAQPAMLLRVSQGHTTPAR